MSAQQVEQQLSFDDLALRVVATQIPSSISTPIVRWRKIVRHVDPPAGSHCSPATFQAVASALADYADRDGGSCRPSIATLESATRLQERTIQYALAALEQRKLIRRRFAGRGAATRYELVLPRPLRGKACGEGSTDDALGTEKGASDDAKRCTPVHPMTVKRSEEQAAASQQAEPDLWKGVLADVQA